MLPWRSYWCSADYATSSWHSWNSVQNLDDPLQSLPHRLTLWITTQEWGEGLFSKKMNKKYSISFTTKIFFKTGRCYRRWWWSLGLEKMEKWSLENQQNLRWTKRTLAGEKWKWFHKEHLNKKDLLWYDVLKCVYDNPRQYFSKLRKGGGTYGGLWGLIDQLEL